MILIVFFSSVFMSLMVMGVIFLLREVNDAGLSTLLLGNAGMMLVCFLRFLKEQSLVLGVQVLLFVLLVLFFGIQSFRQS